MLRLLLLAAMATCDTQHHQGSCDEVRSLRFSSLCTSCAAVLNTPCPRNSRISNHSIQLPNCRYMVEIGGKVKMLPGCSHTCETMVTEHRCCPETWGPLCLPCPSWLGRTCNWHGTCMDGVSGNGTCVCEEGFTGFACQSCKNARAYGEHCASECDCVHGGCNNGPSGDGTCYCKPPYSGPRCDQESATCRNCSAHSYCKKSGDTEACACLPGFKKEGHTCAGNMCSLDVCEPTSDCTDLDAGRYQCRCKVGYERKRGTCFPIDPCASNYGDCPPNSTVCVNSSPGRSHCVCRRGFAGFSPEMGCDLMSACRPNTCHRTAQCHTGQDGMARCTCDAQQVGDGRRCYGNILERLVELNGGAQKGKLTGAIRLFEKGCQLTLSKYGPFTAFIPVLKEPLSGISETFLCKNHLILQQKVLKELKGKDFWTLGTEELRFHDEEKFLFKKDPDKMYSVIQADIPAANGIIHIIDGPITNLHPLSSDTERLSKMTIGEILAHDPKYQAFQALLDNSGLSLPLRGPGPLTVFVPTNEALDKFSHYAVYLQTQARHKLEGLVKHHISPWVRAMVEELDMSDPFPTMGNDPIYITCHEDGRLEFEKSGTHLVSADILASNGVIHEIDGVLVPTSIQPIIPNWCNVTKSRIVYGMCTFCHHLEQTHCPENSVEMVDQHKPCIFQISPHSPRNSPGCAKSCKITETVEDCCKGFYGEDCRPCLGGFQHPCHDGGTCMDGVQGKGTCLCEPQYIGNACHLCRRKNKYGKDCDQDCRCLHGDCENSRQEGGGCRPGSCQAGFSGALCELRVAPCSPFQTEICHYQADCVLRPDGQPACVCKAGYEGDGTSCTPANPCLRPERGGCDRNAQCVYTEQGTVVCVCTEGWTGDGDGCTPINPCLQEGRGRCHDNAECTFLGPGENECMCWPGYQGDGKTCDVINPCFFHNGGCHLRAMCEFSGNGTVNCTCMDIFQGNGTVCYGTILRELDADYRFFYLRDWIQTSGFTGLHGNVTLLAPSPRATSAVLRDRFWTDPYRIKYLLKVHVLPGVYSHDELLQLAGKEVPTLDPKISWKITRTDRVVMIGNATITTADIYASNGFIHIIDQALSPPLSHIPPLPPTLMDYLSHTPTFSLFRKALQLCNFTAQIEGTKRYTVLLPSDQAIKEHLNRTNSTELDEDTVRYHILPEIRLLLEDVWAGMTSRTLLDHHQIIFHVGINNESMANEVLLEGNVTEVRYANLIPISRVLKIHKNICHKEIQLRVRGFCGPCDKPPQCYRNAKPIANSFPPQMISNCKFMKRSGLMRFRVSGCVLDCFSAKKEETCCPGFFGHSCYKCPGWEGQVCSNRGQCQDGLAGSGDCECHPGFNGTACETCSAGRYGADCQSECGCEHGVCMDGPKGDGRCLCHRGWKGLSCTVKIVADECGGSCDVNANCVTGPDSVPKCICIAGYQGNGAFCKEYNPCAQNNGGCSTNANCTQTAAGERACTCRHGYSGDGLVCQKRDPCSEKNGGCHRKATCFPMGPSQVACKCIQGYIGNGLYCTEENPCLNENGRCSPYAWCEYRGYGQYNCTCRRGYVGDGLTCRGSLLYEIKGHPDASWFYQSYVKSKLTDLLEAGPFTAFIPHKDFVDNLTMEVWASANASQTLLRHHLLSCEKLLLSDLQPGSQLLTLSGHRLSFSTKQGAVYLNEKTKIIASDEIASDGVFHFIDGVLFPYDLHNHSHVDSKLNVTAVAKAYGYTTFSKLLQDSGVQDLLPSGSSHRQLTMLWPSERSFLSLSQERRLWLFSPDHAHHLASLVKAHIIRDTRLTAAMLPSVKSVRTVFGSSLSFSCDKNAVGGIVADDGNAKIIERHLEFDGGIAHGIDQLLEPPGLGARCDVHGERRVMGSCRSCLLTPRCWYGTFTGRITPCQLSRPSWGHRSRTSDQKTRGKLQLMPKPGCSAECVVLEWNPRCCRNHYGRDCQVCPGGLEAPCSNHGDCDDGEQGTGNCTCHLGYRGRACELCESATYGPNCTACNCSEKGRCDEGTEGDGSCFCQEGWTGDRCELKLEVQPTCTPKCHPNAVCQPENVCQCEPLYEGDGRTCTASDLCRDYNGGCHLHATCVQAGVRASCSCRPGYTGDGFTCAPVNRCVQEENGGCSQFATCVFTGPNERDCRCLPGYVGSGVQCQPGVVPSLDRCQEDNGGCDPKARCQDLHFHDTTAGVFHLSAPEGNFKLTYKSAQEACEAEGASLATMAQLSQAQQVGMHLCLAGWLDGEKVGFPTRFPSLLCGNNHVGVVTYKTPIDTSSLYDAYCYRVKEVSCDCGPEYVGNGDVCNGNLASVVATDVKFSAFYATLLKLASSTQEGERLMDILSTPSASLTLFVPQDSGFSANQTLTRRDMEYHISTNNSLHLYASLQHGGVIRSRLGYNLSVTVSTADASSSSVSQPSKLVNSQRIVDWDIPATNGIIHVIERPLKAPPPAVVPAVNTDRATAHSHRGVMGPVFAVCLLIGAGTALAYYVLRRRKDPYQFRYFRSKDDEDDDEGSHAEEESRPNLVSIPNPLYSEEPEYTPL